MKKRNLLFFIVILSLLAVSSCRRSHYRINTNGSRVTVTINRLEQDLFTISPGSICDSISYLKKKYGSFLKYFSYVVNIGEPGDSSWATGLVDFCTDRQNNEVYGSVSSIFPDVEKLESDLSDAFSHYKFYFPGKHIPQIYTCITGFNNSLITADSVLGISLDRYLGSECRYYRRLGLYNYQVSKMTPVNITPDCIYGWASSEWDYNKAGYESENVLSSMIHEGKLLYFVKCMLPATDDELIFGFSESQLKFCINNEGRMWEYLIENNLLFNTEMLTKKKLTGDGPFTSYFSSESPGRAAVWLGFRIVESFMQRNGNVTLEQLMKEKDVQSILERARYHPPSK